MPYLISHLLVALALWIGVGEWRAHAQANPAAEALILDERTGDLTVEGHTLQWLENGRAATVEQAQLAQFQTLPATHVSTLNEKNTLWIKLRLASAPGSTARWLLNIPEPEIDHITLYDLRDGVWQAQSAGDTLAQHHWSTHGLYPEFALNLPEGHTHEVLLQVRNFKPIPLPLRLSTSNARETQRLLEAIMLGTVVGLVLTLAVLSLMRYAEYRSNSDLGAALYSIMIAAALGQFNGVLNALLWAEAPAWADFATSIVPLVALAGTLLYGRHLYSLNSHKAVLDRALIATTLASFICVFSYVVLDRPTADQLAGVTLLIGTTMGLAVTWLNWRTGTTLGAWLMCAYLPQFGMALWMTLQALGILPPFWPLRYVMTVAVAASVPALVYALGRATHDRKEIAARAEQLPLQDALTGLLTPNAFQTHLENAYHRVTNEREPVALILVTIVNHDHIRSTMGDPIAEQCLLRAVIKLHRVLRDVDPAARVGSARFAMLMEGMSSRQAVTERLVKLVASGLIPLRGLQPEVTLQFQAACVLLQENPIAPDKALAELSEVLAGISPRTRRPIRFLDPVPTQVASLHSSLLE